MPLRIVIVDPQPFFCETLSHALSSDERFEVVGWATGAREAKGIAAGGAPDVVLTEVDLAEGSGLELIQSLRTERRVLVLTRRREGEILLDAAAAGAEGVISHDIGLPRLLGLLSSDEGFTMDPARVGESLRLAAERRGSQTARGPLAPLTAREREGLDNGAIANRLFISTHTVRTHVGNVLRKLGAHSRAEAARIRLSDATLEDTRVLHIRGPKELGRDE